MIYGSKSSPRRSERHSIAKSEPSFASALFPFKASVNVFTTPDERGGEEKGERRGGRREGEGREKEEEKEKERKGKEKEKGKRRGGKRGGGEKRGEEGNKRRREE